MTSPWPFSIWGVGVIGRIAPKASNGHEYILVPINYFTKWVEVVTYFVLKAKHVTRFIENNIICWFGYLKKSSLSMVPTLRERFKGSWSYTKLSIISAYHTNLKLMES